MSKLPLTFNDLLYILYEPPVYAREPADLLNAHTRFEGVAYVKNPFAVWSDQLLAKQFGVLNAREPVVDDPEPACLKRAETLLERLFECPPYGHCLPHGFHGDRQCLICAPELLEGKPRYLHYTVIDGGLKGCRGLFGDIVRYLIEGISDGELRRDLGYGESRCLRCKRRASRYPGVHLDHDHLSVPGVHGKLDVGASRLDADLADDPDGCVTHDLVFLVAQGLLRRHGNAVSRMDPHGVKVLDGTDDHNIILSIAHDLKLKFLPPYHRFLDEDLADHAALKPSLGKDLVLLYVIHNGSACPAKGVAWPDDEGKTDLLRHLSRVVHGVGKAASRHLKPYLFHRRLELFPVLGLFYRLIISADKFNVVFFQDPSLCDNGGEVEPCLAAERREHCVGPFNPDDLFQHLRGKRFYIYPVCHVRVGHDRGGIAVHEDDPVSFLTECLAGLAS